MIYSETEKKYSDVKIAYIGGGSRGWAWTLMNDLAKAPDISGDVYLYDIDYEAADRNRFIGNHIKVPDGGSKWRYKAVKTLANALRNADFVIISILPGTFDEMASDVHAPEKYGVWQSVGDTTGPGGYIRALRTIPMIRKIARAIKNFCPDAVVINYTNPMAVVVETLYREFPEIRAYGCCHEVFGTQKLLMKALEEESGIKVENRDEIRVNVTGVNHFTWFKSATYRNIDLFPVFRRFADRYYDTGYTLGKMGNWMNDSFQSAARVRFDLFRRFGYIAAAGDRHLAEFMDPDDYLASPEAVKSWTFGLTPVSWRTEDLKKRLAKSDRLLSGEEQFRIRNTGEEGVNQIRAYLGLTPPFVTNINIINRGQIPDLPMGTAVETNAVISGGSIEPVFVGTTPPEILPLILRIARENIYTVDAGFGLSVEEAFPAFSSGHALKNLSGREKRELYRTMIENTAGYLGDYTDIGKYTK